MPLVTPQQPLQIAMLNQLYDAIDPMTPSALSVTLRCTNRALLRAARAQYRLGNLRRGTPLALTSGARFAITAARAVGLAQSS